MRIHSLSERQPSRRRIDTVELLLTLIGATLLALGIVTSFF